MLAEIPAHLLNWIIFLPLVGMVVVLAAPAAMARNCRMGTRPKAFWKPCSVLPGRRRA